MAKTESTFRNMVLSLTLISLGASASLGFVYVITKEPIEMSVLNKKLDAIGSPWPGSTAEACNKLNKRLIRALLNLLRNLYSPGPGTTQP